MIKLIQEKKTKRTASFFKETHSILHWISSKIKFITKSTLKKVYCTYLLKLTKNWSRWDSLSGYFSVPGNVCAVWHLHATHKAIVNCKLVGKSNCLFGLRQPLTLCVCWHNEKRRAYSLVVHRTSVCGLPFFSPFLPQLQSFTAPGIVTLLQLRPGNNSAWRHQGKCRCSPWTTDFGEKDKSIITGKANIWL